MVASIPYNPFLTTNAAGSFDVETDGLVQGTFYDDPAVRFALSGGTLASSETLPAWGGVGYSEVVPNYTNSAPAYPLGTVLARATTLTLGAGALTAFSVFNQAHAMVNNPSSPVPLTGSYGQVNFFRLGSGARVALAMAAELVSLEGEPVTTSLSWDFVQQELIPGIAAYAQQSVSSASYTSSTGILALTFSTAPFGASIGTGANGVYITVSGITGGAVNGSWPVTGTASSGTVVSVQIPTGLGSLSLSGGTLLAGGGILPVKILDVNAGNSMTVSYNSTTGVATWNRSGYAAVVQI